MRSPIGVGSRASGSKRLLLSRYSRTKNLGADLGYFGIFRFHDGEWVQHDDRPDPTVEPWLLVDIYDSDLAMIDYAPKGRGSGEAFIGCPLTSINPGERVLTREDSTREAAGLADWWEHRQGSVSPERKAAKERELVDYFAEDAKGEADYEPADTGEVYVEVKTGRFIAALGLPEIDDLPGHE